MRTLVVLFIVVFGLNSSVAQKQKTNQKAVIQTKITCDHCKECETCGKLFQEKLLEIEGVKMIELDAEKMTITVFYTTKKTNLETIKTAISKLGYDADEIKADPKGYENLDGCCKVEG
jgi:periplasmic mercuric ion binding protein